MKIKKLRDDRMYSKTQSKQMKDSEVAQSCPNLCDPWTVAYQVPPSMGFSRQEYWSGLPFPSPGDLPDPGIEPRSPAFQADALTSEPPGKPNWSIVDLQYCVSFRCMAVLFLSLSSLGSSDTISFPTLFHSLSSPPLMSNVDSLSSYTSLDLEVFQVLSLASSYSTIPSP